MKQKCIFSIFDIDSGWFDMKFNIDKETKAEISASYVLKESPKKLLILLTDLMAEKIHTGYVLFYNEPGANILSLEKGVLTIAYSEDNVDEINIPLYGNMTFDEISNSINIENIDLQQEIDVETFILSVYKAFSKYANNFVLYDKYEENWDYFPQKEWEAFKQYVKQKY